ncbi:hypothetical protein F4803DRAFT_569258 [Xylaria telfairii]|nr:hypothetical protein F4803DRAFT_569258 [Xylaria telfairii]
MVISLLSPESLARRSVRRELRTSPDTSAGRAQSLDGIDSQLELPNRWDNGINSPITSNHRLSYSNNPILSPRSPISTGSFSPISFHEEGVFSPTSPHFKDAPTGSLKRKFKGDGGNDNDIVPLPGFQSLTLPYYESHGCSSTTSPLRTPSVTPEPSEGDVYSRRSSFFHALDPITEKLNDLRIKQNKEPLPPLGALYNSSEFSSQATHQQATPPHVHNKFCQPPSQPQQARKRRAKSSETTHCNVKYLVEELDYIRYQRVEHSHKWALVEARFGAKFPMTEERRTQGLQGVYYRQNKYLPHIENNHLVFMENGHVEAACAKTRDQTEKKHLFTLVYLYPERAMNYPWVSPLDRSRARELNEKRQKQMKNARLYAIERGTYIETLTADDPPCACCPDQDRERDPEKRAESKPIVKVKKEKPGNRLRSSL